MPGRGQRVDMGGPGHLRGSERARSAPDALQTSPRQPKNAFGAPWAGSNPREDGPRFQKPPRRPERTP